jgi:hypothetical protein
VRAWRVQAFGYGEKGNSSDVSSKCNNVPAGAAGDQSTAPFRHHHAAGLTTFGTTSVGVSGVPASGWM